MLIAIPFFENSFASIFILVLKNLNHVQVISIVPQSDYKLLKNLKYITYRAFWQNIFEKWDSSSLSHVLYSTICQLKTTILAPFFLQRVGNG